MAETTETIATTGPYLLPLGDTPYAAPYTSIGQEICENLFVEKSTSETSAYIYYYVGIHGMKNWIVADSKSSAACRGLYVSGLGTLYGVWGDKLYKIESNATRTLLGELDTNVGNVSFADNGTELILVDGAAGYISVMGSNTFDKITDEYFPGIADDDPTKAPNKVVCIDTYFIVNRQGSNEYYWSTPGYIDVAFDTDRPDKFNKWNGLQFGRKIGDSDEIVSMAKSVNLLWLFGKQSIEVHYDTGDYNGQLFGRMSNALVNFGCAAKDSVINFANTVFWIGADQKGTVGIFSAGTDFMPQRISTRGVESYMQSMPDFTDATAFSYAADGHIFICWYFPSGNQTWVYDIVTGKWHRRTHYNYQTGAINAHRGLYCAFAFGKNLIGDRLCEAVYELDLNYFVNDEPDGDGVNYINRIRTSPVQVNYGKLTRYKTLQIMMQQGVGLNDNDDAMVGKDPKAMIAYSNDSGNTWSSERDVAIGAMGKHGTRTRLTMLGSGRNRCWRIRITDPVRVILAGMLVDFEVLGR